MSFELKRQGEEVSASWRQCIKARQGHWTTLSFFGMGNEHKQSQIALQS
jgi:muconolactone delta-isomerase